MSYMVLVSWVRGGLVWVVLVDGVLVHAVPVHISRVHAALVRIALRFVVVLAQAYVHQLSDPYSAKWVDLAVHTRIVLVAMGTVCYSAPPCLRSCLRNCLSLTPLW